MPKENRILITGGAGFIGSHVADGYIEAGYDVSIVDNLYTGRKENINHAARFYDIDIRAIELEDVFKEEQPEIVNHHAAQISVPDSVKDPRFDAEVNVIGFINVLQCSIKYSVKKIFFISSGGAIYGEAEEYPTSESYTPKPLSPYAITKLVSENYLEFYRHQYGLDYTVLRYANIYGPRQIPKGEAGVVAIFIENILSETPSVVYCFPDEPEGMERDYCYVGDVVKANIMATKKGSTGIFNIGTGIATKTLNLYNAIYKIVKNQNPELKIPDKAPARDGDIGRSCLNIEKAKRSLGWTPTVILKDGLKKTIEWYLAR
jgi:UDP-glucose 4-epimerase